jgi:hypothetical protein
MLTSAVNCTFSGDENCTLGGPGAVEGGVVFERSKSAALRSPWPLCPPTPRCRGRRESERPAGACEPDAAFTGSLAAADFLAQAQAGSIAGLEPQPARTRPHGQVFSVGLRRGSVFRSCKASVEQKGVMLDLSSTRRRPAPLLPLHHHLGSFSDRRDRSP